MGETTDGGERMNRHKKTHPTAATVERVEAGAGLAGASTSDSQSTTSAPPGQAVKIADLLGHGQSAAVPLHQRQPAWIFPGRHPGGSESVCKIYAPQKRRNSKDRPDGGTICGDRR